MLRTLLQGTHSVKGMFFYGIVRTMPWDYTEEEYQKQAKADPIWHLERLINHGFGEEKIDRALLKKHLPELNIPEDARAFLELILWNKY